MLNNYINKILMYKDYFKRLKSEVCYDYSNSSWLKLVKGKGYTLEDTWGTNLWDLWYRTYYDDGGMLCIRNLNSLRPQTIEEYKETISRLESLKEEFEKEFKFWGEKGGKNEKVKKLS